MIPDEAPTLTTSFVTSGYSLYWSRTTKGASQPIFRTIGLFLEDFELRYRGYEFGAVLP